MAHFAGTIMARLRSAIADKVLGAVRIDQPQSNSLYGIHQARVRVAGDPTAYRLIVAPMDAPISIGGCSADTHFTRHLGDD